MSSERFARSIAETRWNAALGWLVVVLLAGLGIQQAWTGSYRWPIFVGLAIALLVLPTVALRDLFALPPWELLVVVAIPVVDAAILGVTIVSPVATYLAVAAIALVLAVDVHNFTSVRMNRQFAIAFVVIATLAVGALWNIAQWFADTTLGTTYLVGGRTQAAANHAMMVDFLYAAVAGLLAGVLFTWYVQQRSFAQTERSEKPREPPDENSDTVPPYIRERLNVPEKRIRQLSLTLQIVLVGLLGYGLVVRDVTTITNASIALVVTFLPAVLKRNYRLPIEPELLIWLTAAAFLHTLGSAGLYGYVEQWDSLTHAMSASLVAATGYTIVRSIDLHSDDVYLPSKMMFAFILLFVLAVGVVWELVEFALDLAARQFGFEAVLAQHGINNTVGDLLFNLAGAIVAATLGATYLTGVSQQLVERFGG